MENRGYEDETSNRAKTTMSQNVVGNRDVPMADHLNRNGSSLPIVQERNSSVQAIVPSRADTEAHVYEDIVICGPEDPQPLCSSSFRLSANSSNNNERWKLSTPRKWPGQPSGPDNDMKNDNAYNDVLMRSFNNNNNTSNFHRNLTLPLTKTTGLWNADDSRFSVHVANRERIICPTSGDDDPFIYESCVRSARNANASAIVTNHVVDKPGRRRKKKDCKHCKSKTNSKAPIISQNFSAQREVSTIRGENTIVMPEICRRIQSNNNESIIDGSMKKHGLERLFALPDGEFPPLNSTHHRRSSLQISSLNDSRKNSVFAISNNTHSPVCTSGDPKPLNYDKNDADLRLVSVDINDDKALITPQKNRAGMKVNSIYSQEHWHTNKDAPIFVTDVNEQIFQRAYSLPTRVPQGTVTQNRINLRRSAKGEPPPHPARLRKNRYGWTLDFSRPLDDAGCTRSIILLLIAVLALLGIGGIALYIVFEPEKLQIIQQYLKSSTSDAILNSTFTEDLLEVDANVEITTLGLPTSVLFTESLARFHEETTPEAETTESISSSTSETSTEIIPDQNVTRYCDDCYESEVCVALVGEEVPICRIGLDPLDPTGCNGFCLINKQKCHRLDFDAFRCVEVERYCLDDEWTCSNTLCIPLVKRCDGHMNCYDHSDEYDCDCDLQTHFQCGNETSCLPRERRCDGKIDCWDATDEINCTIGEDLGWSCPSSNEFTCSNGECILKTRFCDGLRDCTDGSDEPHGCQGRCNKHEFSCLNGRCITKGMKCNGIDDCGDGSDERYCRDRIYKKLGT